jgi:two-component system cell cycle sensor histidine kinase/response regulator CckA
MSDSPYKSVLVVEDDEGVAILERRALERRGFNVTVASNLDGAVQAIERTVFDLIVSDYRLESGTGLDLLRRIQKLGRDIPVILVTGFSDEATVIEAIRSGARDFVPKSTEYLQYLPDAAERVLKAVQTERELAESESRFHLFMDHSPAAAFIKDEHGRLIYANRLMRETIGNRECLGKTDYDLWPKEVADRIHEHDSIVLQTGQPTEAQQSFVVPSGEVRHFRSYKFPMQDSRGRRFIGGMAVDVTQQRVAEEALRHRDELLRQSQKMEAIGTLAGGVAHEFNNLLQAVLGYTRFARNSIDQEHPAQADLQVVVLAAERAAMLTQQLLSFSRRDYGQLAALDVNATIRELAVMLRPLLGESIEIVLLLEEGIGAIQADAVQIQQLLMNLCINARDAMPEGGTITIETAAVDIDLAKTPHVDPAFGPYLRLIVTDTGCGMDEETMQKIFEPFFTTKPVGKGTGLGLAMVYGAVQHHNGAIHVESEPGKGTRFLIYLPIVRAESVESAVPETVESRPGRETILLAEDEPLVLELARRTLVGADYHVIAASNGEEAVQAFRKHAGEISLVILDAVMPQRNGWEALGDIRALDPSVPAIITTGYDRHRAPPLLEGDPPKHLKKPFEVERLLEMVQNTLAERLACR